MKKYKYKCKNKNYLIEMNEESKSIIVKGTIAKTETPLKDLNKALILFDVSNQRELLIAYEIKISSCSDEQAETKVDSYLASISN